MNLEHFDEEEEIQVYNNLNACYNSIVENKQEKNNMDEYTYEEELKLSADRNMFDKCCLSCCAEDAFYDIDLIPEEKENTWTF